MKITSILLVLMTLTNYCIAQKLSISKMIEYYNEDDWQKINIDLMSMGWKFDNVGPGSEEEGSYHVVLWTYEAENYNTIVRLFTLKDTPPRVHFATASSVAYEEIMGQLEIHDFDLVSSELDDYISSSSYENNFYSLRISLRKTTGVYYDFWLNAKYKLE